MKASERDFLKKIKQAITLNPFSSERSAIDLELTGMSPTSSRDDIFQRLIDQVGKAIDRANLSARKGREPLSTEDQKLLRYGFLFQVFYLFCDDYDQLIKKQMEIGDAPCEVLFAKDILRRLTEFGLHSREAMRYFALFFQMRRAFFFIQAIAGESRCVKELRKSLWNNIFTHNIERYDTYLWNRMEDFSTMLLGETGTGKGLAASAIGRSGFIPFHEKKGCFTESFTKTFLAINLSQYPEQLIESELFGHRKGAFTGAIEAHQGIFSRCSPFGAIFLDEIGDVSVPVQIKLLQVLQERLFSPVGSRAVERFQGRVIAATHQQLTVMRKEGKFREDFYYRLCSDVIEVPSLRQRLDEHPDEMCVILNFIIERILGRPSPKLVEEMNAFIFSHLPPRYPWPGNIRELEQCVRQILLHNSYQWQIPEPETDGWLNAAIDQQLAAQQLLEHYCGRLYDKLGTYEAVAQVAGLDRRTVKKYILQHR
jgi:hypothetical protein